VLLLGCLSTPLYEHYCVVLRVMVQGDLGAHSPAHVCPCRPLSDSSGAGPASDVLVIILTALVFMCPGSHLCEFCDGMFAVPIVVQVNVLFTTRLRSALSILTAVSAGKARCVMVGVGWLARGSN